MLGVYAVIDLLLSTMEYTITNASTMSSEKIINPRSSECPICSARQTSGTTEVFVVTEGADRHFFNVDRAKDIVADARAALAISDATVLQLLAINECEVAHLDHVDPEKPGIMGLLFGGLVLLDGIHRAACCLRDQRPFKVQVLNHEESKTCIVREDILSRDPQAIAAKLRRVLGTAPRLDRIEAAIDCSQQTLEKVRRLLTPEENQRLELRLLQVTSGRNG
jgi:hypothetical protein